MNPWFEPLLLAISIITLSYVVLVMFMRNGWRRGKAAPHSDAPPSASISVVVPARNESQHLPELLQQLANQQYPASLLQLVLVDDASQDNTFALMEAFAAQHPQLNIVPIHLEDDPDCAAPKKRALAAGIEQADVLSRISRFRFKVSSCSWAPARHYSPREIFRRPVAARVPPSRRFRFGSRRRISYLSGRSRLD